MNIDNDKICSKTRIPTAILLDEIEGLVRRHWKERHYRIFGDKAVSKNISTDLPLLIDIREYLLDAAICGGLSDHLVARWFYDGSAIASIDFGLNPNGQYELVDKVPVDIINFGIDNDQKAMRVHVLELGGHLVDLEYVVDTNSVDAPKKWMCVKREEWMVQCRFESIIVPSDIWCKNRKRWDEYTLSITSRVRRALGLAFRWRPV
jgi:hypothetical protein